MLFMGNKYLVGRELTPLRADCLIFGCPAIYEATRVEDARQDCILGACPDVIDTPNWYAVIGTRLDEKQIKETCLEGKVAPHEAVVFVPKDIIDKRRN